MPPTRRSQQQRLPNSINRRLMKRKSLSRRDKSRNASTTTTLSNRYAVGVDEHRLDFLEEDAVAVFAYAQCVRSFIMMTLILPTFVMLESFRDVRRGDKAELGKLETTPNLQFKHILLQVLHVLA